MQAGPSSDAPICLGFWVRRFTYVVISLLLLLTLSAGTPRRASAHAELVSSSPASGAVLPTSPATLTLRFSEQITPLSAVLLFDATGARVGPNPATIDATRTVLRLDLPPLGRGTYTADWTTVSADDGHVAQGSVTFTIGSVGPAANHASASAGNNAGLASTIAGIARLLADWLVLAGSAVWVGLPLFQLLVIRKTLPLLPNPPAQESAMNKLTLRLAYQSATVGDTGLAIVLVGTVSSLLLQAASVSVATGLPTLTALTEQVFASQYGLIWLAREVILIAVVAISLPLITTIRAASTRAATTQATATNLTLEGSLLTSTTVQAPPMRTQTTTVPPGWRIIWNDARWRVVLGLLALFLLSINGHAASLGVRTPWAIFVDWAHLVAMAIWIGGMMATALVVLPALAPLATSARARALTTILPAFSPWALGAAGTAMVTGMLNAGLRWTTLDAFLDSVYGRALIAKLLVLAVLLAVSRYHAFVLRPRLAVTCASADSTETNLSSQLHRLETWLRVPPVLGLILLLCVAIMWSNPAPV